MWFPACFDPPQLEPTGTLIAIMTDTNEKALLPPGLGDVLAPGAQIEAETVERLMSAFGAHGYERVKPPLIEFEENLLADRGAAIADQTFRLMDPISRRMLALRPDMTLQVARIAETRLKNAPRPLRLAYAGEVVRIKGGQLRPERQFGQTGVELIGTDATEADVEVILMAVEALENLGVKNTSVDLGMPPLVPAIINDMIRTPLSKDDHGQLRQALDRKDQAAIKAMADVCGKDAIQLLTALLSATGPAKSGLDKLQALNLDRDAGNAIGKLGAVIHALLAAKPDLMLTIDPIESRGFEYHTGVSFTFFAKNIRGELGSGGRYTAANGSRASEEATGFTLFMDTILRSLPQPKAGNRLFLDPGTDPAIARNWRSQGWVAILGMDKTQTGETEARRLCCTHILEGGEARKL